MTATDPTPTNPTDPDDDFVIDLSPDGVADRCRERFLGLIAERPDAAPTAYYAAWFTADELDQCLEAVTTAQEARLPMRLRVLFEIVRMAVEYDWAHSSRSLRKAIDGANSAIDAARDELIEQGLLARHPGRNGGSVYWPAGFVLSDSTLPEDWTPRPHPDEDPETEAIDVDELLDHILATRTTV